MANYVLDTQEALSLEAQAIFGRTLATGVSEQDFNAQLHTLNASALCLSGGGVRSATFALGVIQALAKHRVLSQFSYLSTVSGGGYIGGWLSRWIRAEQSQGENRASTRAEAITRADAIERVQTDLHPGTETVLSRIRQLRDNALYLTPRSGVASPDLWTAVVIVLRNIILNWLLLGPVLTLVAMSSTLLFAIADRLTVEGASILLSIGVAFAAGAGLFAYISVPSRLASRDNIGVQGLPSGWEISRAGAWPILLHAVLLSMVYVPVLGKQEGLVVEWSSLPWSALRDGGTNPLWHPIWLTTAFGLVAVALAELVQRIDRLDRLISLPHLLRLVWNLAVIVAIAYVSFLLLGTGLWLAAKVPCQIRPEVLLVAGPPWVTLTTLLASALYVSHRSIEFGGEFDREWLGRLSALKVMPALLWLVLSAICLLLSPAVFAQEGPVWDWAVAAVAAVSGPIAVFGGRSALTVVGSAITPKDQKRAAPVGVIVVVATFAFLLIVLMTLAEAEHALAVAIRDAWVDTAAQSTNYMPRPADLLSFHVLILVALLAFGGVASRRINVNRYSIHALYRNRLMRAFLGGALPPRVRDSFTGLDFRDDVRLASLKADADNRLFHVVNVAMNIAGSAKGAQQERKAESFVMTPLACGSAKLDLGATGEGDPTGAYVASEDYGGNEPYLEGGAPGIHLATAMTISGAAANSSMGYNSSPATALLLTLFNVRLGCWLPNPAWRGARPADGDTRRISDDVHFQRSGPRNALRPLLTELLGRTSHQSKYLQLSDGGHFENLGIYEMVRRRCRFILVSDAECDAQAHLEGLGNAVRKCRIDFGVDIRFSQFPIAARATGTANDRGFAVGLIRYPEGVEGILFYIKASFYDLDAFSRSMPVDIRHYAAKHLDFPHETTGDQWFSESQFESYRKLGLELTTRVLDQLHSDPGDFDGMVRAANRLARLPSAGML